MQYCPGGRGARRAPRPPATDWLALADAWRAHYQPQLETVRTGHRPWTRLEVLNRESLDQVLADFGLAAFPAAERNAFNLAWRQLAPWPDTVPGLLRLQAKFIGGGLLEGVCRK